MTAPTTELTGAALLREAARVMRERARVATPMPWEAYDDCVMTPAGTIVCASPAPDVEDPDMPHIASWHPAVALAVAEWLGEQADAWDLAFGVTQLPSRGVDEPPAVHFGDPEAARLGADYHARRALSIARAYLGLS